MDPIRAGRSFLLAEYSYSKPHLWLVLTDPHGNPEEIVAVMVRTAKYHTDDTVILEAGDHPFIKHQSCVHYSTARRFRISSIRGAIEKGHCHPREDMTSELLARARAGLLASAFTVNVIREYCRARLE